MTDSEAPDDNPFRLNSPRNVLARAREQLRLARHWLIRHERDDPARDAGPSTRLPDDDAPPA